MTSTFHMGDNLSILSTLSTNTIDLVYLDPPFNSGRDYEGASSKFVDTWGWDSDTQLGYNKLPADLQGLITLSTNSHSNSMGSYLVFMALRLVELHRVLKSTGSLYLHVDPTASHYLKLVLDTIFGSNNFRNEVIWHYTGGGRSKTVFSKKHDVILSYAKDIRQCYFDADANRIPYDETSGYAKTGIVSKSGKRYMPNPLGKALDDVWDIPIINPMSKERTGYPTQKPLALLERIIKASSNEGDVVLDPFCGSGTTIEAAVKLGRNVIGIDLNDNTAIIEQRLKAHQV